MTAESGRTAPYISHSAATLFGACPRKYHLRKVAEVTPLPTMAAVGGKAAHSLIEEWDRSGCPDWGRDEIEQRARETLTNLVEAGEAETGVPRDQWRVSGRATKAHPNKEDYEWWQNNLPVFVSKYIHWRWANPELEIWTTPAGEPAIELEISVEVPGLPVPFLCYIDRIFIYQSGPLVIWDAKFGSMPVEDLSQLARYAMAVELQYGVRPQYGAIYKGRVGALDVLKDGKTLIPLAHLSTSVVAANLAAEYRLMQTGEYPARPGRHCSWCDVRHACTWAGGNEAWRWDPTHPAYVLGA